MDAQNFKIWMVVRMTQWRLQWRGLKQRGVSVSGRVIETTIVLFWRPSKSWNNNWVDQLDLGFVPCTFWALCVTSFFIVLKALCNMALRALAGSFWKKLETNGSFRSSDTMAWSSLRSLAGFPTINDCKLSMTLHPFQFRHWCCMMSLCPCTDGRWQSQDNACSRALYLERTKSCLLHWEESVFSVQIVCVGCV